MYISEQETLVPRANLHVTLEQSAGDDEMLDFKGFADNSHSPTSVLRHAN